MYNLISFMLVLFLVLALCKGQTPCLSSAPYYRTYNELKNTTDWDGYLLGFCQGLFETNETIFPISEAGCTGELGNMTIIRRTIGTLQPACRKAVSIFMCFLYLPLQVNGMPTVPCTSEQSNVTNSSPRTLWNWVSDSCPSDVTSFVAQGFDKAFTGVDTTLESLTFLRSTCHVVDDPKHSNWKPEKWECAKGMNKVQGSDLDNESVRGCAFPCPGPFYTENEWNSLKSLLRVPMFISFLFSVMITIKLSLNEKKRKFPAILIIILSGLIALINFSFCFTYFYELHGLAFEDMWCENNYTPRKGSWNWCGIQGIFSVYFGKGATLTWFAILVNMFLVLVKGQLNDGAYSTYYYALIFGYPLIGFIAGIATDKYGYIYGSPYCLIVSERRGLYQYLFLFGDLFLFVATGTILTLWIIIHLKRTKMSFSTGRSHSNLFSIKIFFALLYSFLTVFIALYLRIQGSINEDTIAESTTKYATCLINQFITGGTDILNQNREVIQTPIDYSVCSLSDRPDFTGQFAASVVSVLSGFYISAIFGLEIHPQGRIMTIINMVPIMPQRSQKLSESFSQNNPKQTTTLTTTKPNMIFQFPPPQHSPKKPT